MGNTADGPLETPEPMGRPSSFKDEYVEQVVKLCRLGAIDADLADFFDVSETTINNWKNAHPEFLEALKTGKVVADIEVANALYNKALGGDTTAMIFWLKNRRPDLWRDKHDVEHTGDGLPTLVVRREVDDDEDDGDDE